MCACAHVLAPRPQKAPPLDPLTNPHPPRPHGSYFKADRKIVQAMLLHFEWLVQTCVTDAISRKVFGTSMKGLHTS